MDLLVQNWIVAAAMTLLIIAIFFLLSKYYFRRRHTYLNNVRDLAIHPDNYRLYFLVLGIFFPATEIFMEIFKVRTKSALASSVIFGVFSIALFLGSRYINVLRANMHKIFLGFYIVYSAFIFYNISIYPTDLPALVEFTLVVMFAHYAFYNVKQFVTYIISAFIVLLGMNLVGMVGIKFLVLYYNIILIATALNYTKHVVDLNIRKNLFWAYNIVNKGSLLVLGINKEGRIAFVSDNVKNILGYEKAEFISKKWPHSIMDLFDKTQPDGFAEGADTKYHLQRIKSKKGGYQLIEWQEDAVYEDLTIKVGRDITAIKQAEDELRQTNARLKTLLTSSGDFLFVLTRDLVFTEYYNFNEGVESSARPQSFFIGKKLSDIGYPAAAFEHFSEAITHMLSTRERTTVEYCLPFPDGEKWFSVVISTPFHEDGIAREIVCVARNITEQKRSEIALKRTKEVLEQTSRVASVGGWEYNLNTNKVYASNVAVALHELPDNSVLDVEIVLDFYKEGINRNTIKAAVKKIIADGIPIDLELQLITAKGKEIWVRTIAHAEFEDQVCKKLYGTIQDITARKVAEIADEQHQEVLALHNRILTQVSTTPFDQYGSLENCLEAISEATAEGLNVNRASIWDYTGSTLICRDLYEQSTRQHSADMVLVAKDFPAYFEGIQSDLAIVADDAPTNQYTFEFADIYLNPLGIKSMLDVPIRIGGKLVGVLCCEHTGSAFKNWTEDDIVFARSMADIVSLALEADKRQKAEIELKKSQRAYEDLVTTIPVGVFKYGRILGGDNKLLYVSPRLCEICGLSASELLHTSTVPEKLLSKEDILIFAHAVKEAVKHKNIFEWEGKLLTGDGGRIVRLEGRPHQSEHGDYIWNGIMYDITDRKRAEMELLATNERLESLIEAIPDAIFFKDGAGKWLVTNEDAKKVFNLHNFDWLGKTDLEMAVINPDLREEYEICLGNDEKTWRNNKLSIYTEYFKDEQGIPREYEIRKMPVYNQDGNRKAMVIIGTDVTERRMVEEQLRQNLAALKSTQEKLIATQIEQEKFVSLIKYSDAFIAIADMTGKAFFLNEKAKIMSGYGNAYQHTYVRDYHSKAARKRLKETINDIVMNNGIWRGEFDVVNSKTQEVFVTDATMYIIHDPVSQEPIALATVQIDITERKQAEQELLQAKQQAEAANRAKSEFLANMSHELRTPLNGVIGFTDLLLKTRLDNIQQEYMSLVHKSANALLEVINDILDFSKIESGKLELEIEKIELTTIGSQVVEAIAYQAQHKKLKVWLHIAPTTPCYIWADSVRLKQVLINLLGNATKFTAQGEIELKVEVLSEETPEKTRFRFSVKDTGIGIKPENQQKIFEAFSQEDASTTRRFGGTGLGLAISNKLLSLMGSTLQLKSEPGKGSTFYFDVTFKSMDCDDAAWQNRSPQLPGVLADATTLHQDVALVRSEISDKSHFDIAEFKSRIGENADMVNGLLFLIQEHLETFPAELRQYIAVQNLAEIKKAANSLKSTASSACFGLLLQQARKLESFTFFEDAAINALYGEISAEIQHVKSLLAVHLQ